MQINEVVRYEVEDAIALVTVNNPPVSALSAAVRGGVYQGVEKAMEDGAVRAAVIICEGRTFFAGADITEFGKPPVSPTLVELEAFVEDGPKPVIAAIHGTALGGGLELALVSHYRIAVPSAKCGLPEVNLGLLPGAGGTQRLPRIVGVEKALEMVTSGKPIGAKAALEYGLVDALAEEGELRRDALEFAQKLVAEGKPLRRVRDLDEKLAAVRGKPEIFDNFRKANARKFRGFLAPEYNIRCVENAVNMPFEEGVKEERRLFNELVTGRQSAAQRHVFFAERQVNKIPGVSKETPRRNIARVGVIGAGTMGGGIAMAFLNAGFPVTLVEMTGQALERGVSIMRSNYDGTVKKGRLRAEQVDERMNRLTPSTDYESLSDCDLIIEAVFEQMDIKKQVFSRLDGIAKPGAILATNTSYLDIDEIASATSRPQDVVGMHFFSPAHIMRLLEVVRGKETGLDVIATAQGLAKPLGKVGVVVGNCFGFVGNRMLAQRQREAETLILEGALPWDVDRVLYDFGFPMGPFQMRDMAGMDVGWDPETSSSSTVREILNEMGRRGQKTSAGYYDYDENRKGTPSPVAEKVILDFAAREGYERRPVSDQEILERCLYSMVNEGAKILEEGIAARSSDIDTVWITGYGWPAYRGGPMFWAEEEGLAQIVSRLRAFEEAHGELFTPAKLLVKLAEEGGSFSSVGS